MPQGSKAHSVSHNSIKSLYRNLKNTHLQRLEIENNRNKAFSLSSLLSILLYKAVPTLTLKPGLVMNKFLLVISESIREAKRFKGT